MNKKTLVEKEFFWGVFGSLHYNQAKDYIIGVQKDAEKIRAKEQKDLIKIKKSIFDTIK